MGVSVNDHDPDSAMRAVRSGLFDTFQIIYNVFDQSPDAEFLPACLELGRGVIARVPFDEGALTGTITPDTEFPDGDFRNHYFGGDRKRQVWDRILRLKKLLLDGEARTLPELALRFCLAHDAVSTVIPGMRKVANVEANTAVSDGRRLTASLKADAACPRLAARLLLLSESRKPPAGARASHAWAVSRRRGRSKCLDVGWWAGSCSRWWRPRARSPRTTGVWSRATAGATTGTAIGTARATARCARRRCARPARWPWTRRSNGGIQVTAGDGNEVRLEAKVMAVGVERGRGAAAGLRGPHPHVGHGLGGRADRRARGTGGRSAIA